MIDFKDLNTFYDESRKYFRINRNDFVNVKIDNVINYASEEKNFGNVIDMTKQNNSYLPFAHCLIYGKYKEEKIGEVMIYFLCVRIKKIGLEHIKVADVINESGKIISEVDESDVGIYHGNHGVQLIDMFIAKDNGQLIYVGGRVETFYSDYKRMNSYPISDKDSPVQLTEEEENSMFVHYYTALEFFHCRNVKVVNNPIPEKLKKSQTKKSGRAKLESSTIKVYPFIYSKDLSKREIHFDDFTSNNNAHFTRGHFRTYTESAKLFGKYVGTYFISPHWRGSHTDEKIKDYELIAE